MSGSTKKKLYLAKNISELNKRADENIPKVTSNANVVLSSLTKLYLAAEDCFREDDEEKAYILYMRYFNLFKAIKKSNEYKKQQKYFDEVLGKKNQIKAIERAEKLSESLKTRYEELEAVEVSQKLEALNGGSNETEKPDVVSVASSSNTDSIKTPEEGANPTSLNPSAPKGGVSVQMIYRLMKDPNVQVILMDIRSSEDFNKSCIKSECCISVPSEYIYPGCTAGQIEKQLSSKSLTVFKTRGTVDHVILFNWNCSATNIQPNSPINCMKEAIFKWDLKTILRGEPLIMEGGYEEWLLCYPSLTTNPKVDSPYHSNSAVPDLVSIESINYDFMETPPSSPPKKDQPPEEPVVPVSSVNQNLPDILLSNSPQPAILPQVDRSTKPKPRSNHVPNNIEPTHKKTSHMENQIENNLRINASNINKTVNLPKQDGHDKVPSFDRAAKPVPKSIPSIPPYQFSSSDEEDVELEMDGIARVPNGTKTGELSRKEDKTDSWLDDVKRKNAKDVADLMRQKKKLEEELILMNKQLKEMNVEEKADSQLDNMKKKNAKEVADLMRKKKKLAEELSLMAEQLNENEEMQKSRLKTDSSIEADKNNKEDEDVEQERNSQVNGDVAQPASNISDFVKSQDEKNSSEIVEEDKIARAKKIEMENLERMKAAEEEKRQEAKRQELERNRLKKEEAKRKIEAEKAAQEKIQRDAKAAELAKKEREAAARKQAEAEANRARMEKEKQQADELKRTKEMKEKSAKMDSTQCASSSLPDGWEKRYDQNTKSYYYIDHTTKQTSWTPPTKPQARSGAPPSQYKTTLKDEKDRTPDRSTDGGGGGLKRSHSTPNIAKLIQDENAARNSRQIPINRSAKPSPVSHAGRIPISTDVSESKMRNLQPTWGSTGPGLTGLRNLGNTCYMNSIIQCLSNTTPLTIYFLSNSYVQDINRENKEGYRGEVASEFAVLIKSLWSGQYKAVSPRDFRGVVCKMDSMFATSQHQDSQELLEYLMNGLNEDLNKVRHKPQLPVQNNDNVDEIKAADDLWQKCRYREDSIIVDLFRGQYKSIVMCMKCDKKSVLFEPFMCLTLPIPSPTRCSLSDCLLQFSKEEKMTGDCQWHCPRCACKRDATKRIVIWRLPPILLVHLKRFHYQGIWRDKITANVDFPLEGLDMERYISGPSGLRQPYNLFAVSNHFGTLDGGHYTAVCKNPSSGKWYKFDDSDVSEISRSDIKSSAGYLLFYTSMKLDSMKI